MYVCIHIVPAVFRSGCDGTVTVRAAANAIFMCPNTHAQTHTHTQTHTYIYMYTSYICILYIHMYISLSLPLARVCARVRTLSRHFSLSSTHTPRAFSLSHTLSVVRSLSLYLCRTRTHHTKPKGLRGTAQDVAMERRCTQRLESQRYPDDNSGSHFHDFLCGLRRPAGKVIGGQSYICVPFDIGRYHCGPPHVT